MTSFDTSEWPFCFGIIVDKKYEDIIIYCSLKNGHVHKVALYTVLRETFENPS